MPKIELSHLMLVSLQFAGLAYLYLSGPVFPESTVLLVLYVLFILFGVWAIASMRFVYNVFPEPLENSKHVTGGPYSIVRHPMYAALILMTAMLLIDRFTFYRLASWLVLTISLILKSRAEEKILLKKFRSYADYCGNTNGFVPFIK